MNPEIVLANLETHSQRTFGLGDGYPKVTGWGGWEEVARPKRKGISDWTQAPLIRMPIPLLLDGWRSSSSVQRHVDILKAWASSRAGKRPPRLKILSGPVPHTDLVWVIEDLDFDEALLDDNGVLVRQSLTLNLLEFEAGEVLKTFTPAQTKKALRSYVVKSGDTLLSIASKKLGNGKRWREIAKLNKIRDPRKNAKLKVGKRLKLP